MLFDDTYVTVAAQSEGLYKDKGSKFIAYAFPAGSEEAMKVKLNEIKAEHPKARHHCWALRLSPDRSVYRVNDDGEPSGSAGRPILNAILSANLTNIAVVVVRYFGGTLLGVPGLINAYKESTREALDAAIRIEKTVNDLYLVRFDYTSMNDVMRIVKEQELQICKNDYDHQCVMHLEIRKASLNRSLEKFDKIDGLTYKYLSTSM